MAGGWNLKAGVRLGITRLRLAECPDIRMSLVLSAQDANQFRTLLDLYRAGANTPSYRRLLYSGGIRQDSCRNSNRLLRFPQSFMVPLNEELADAATVHRRVNRLHLNSL
jgi:hypothetical protein